MNVCEDRHEPKYQVTYRGAKHTNQNTHVWLVCKACMENQDCFGSKDQIESIITIKQ